MAAAAAAIALVGGLAFMHGAEPVQAQGLEVGGSGDRYYLNDEFTVKANIEMTFGAVGDEIYFGDWDGNGTDTPMLRRGTTFQYSNTHESTPPHRSFTYGRAGDQVFVGDWNGDGRDSLAVRRGAQFFISNTLADGSADTVVQYGRDGDHVLVGDWDANGLDTFSVRRGAEYHVRNSMTSGPADIIVQYGREADLVLVGDWDGDGRDSFAVRRDATYYIANAIRPGEADITVVYGRTDDVAFAGDWDGDRRDTLGVRRVHTPPPPPADPVNCTGDGGANAAPAQTCAAMAESATELLGLINDAREEEELPPLELDPCLADAAQHWSESMVWLNSSGSAHNPDLTADMRACGVKGWAENVARSRGPYPAAQEILDRWMNSDAHHANLMRENMTHIGVGVASRGDNTWYYVLDFGRR